jgi:integrase
MDPYFKCKKVKGKDYITLIYHYKTKGIELSTGIKCLKSNFGDGKRDNPIKKTDADYIQKNEILRLFREDVKRAIFNLQTNGLSPLAEYVKLELKRFKGDTYFDSKIKLAIDRHPVSYVAQKYIESETAKRTSYSRSIKFRINLILKFIQNEYKDEVHFRDINDELYKRFQNHLVDESYSNATISKIISQFRQFLRWAKKNGYTSDVYIDYHTSLNTNYKPIIIIEEDEIKKLYHFKKFDFYQSKLNKDGQPVYLDYYSDWPNDSYIIVEEKLTTLKDDLGYTIRDSKGKIESEIPKGEFNHFTIYEVVKDMLLFSVATSLRYSDVINLKVADFNYKTRIFSIFQKKTSLPVEIIENELSKRIWHKYTYGKSSSQYVFPLPCKSEISTRHQYLTYVNKYLKKIGEHVGFRNLVEYIKMSGKVVDRGKIPLSAALSFHIARKTHATLANRKGVDAFSLARQLGHTAKGITGRYVGSNDEKLKTLFDFVFENEKKVSNKKKANSILLSVDSDLKSQLSKLKLMLDEGLLDKGTYDDRVDLLLDKYGFK